MCQPCIEVALMVKNLKSTALKERIRIYFIMKNPIFSFKTVLIFIVVVH
jgi:hypothetical protein